VKVIVTITSTKLLNEYKFTIGNYQTTIKATDVNGVISLAPNENSLYTLTVVGESTVSMDFTIYTDSM